VCVQVKKETVDPNENGERKDNAKSRNGKKQHLNESPDWSLRLTEQNEATKGISKLRAMECAQGVLEACVASAAAARLANDKHDAVLDQAGSLGPERDVGDHLHALLVPLEAVERHAAADVHHHSNGQTNHEDGASAEAGCRSGPTGAAGAAAVVGASVVVVAATVVSAVVAPAVVVVGVGIAIVIAIGVGVGIAVVVIGVRVGVGVAVASAWTSKGRFPPEVVVQRWLLNRERWHTRRLR